VGGVGVVGGGASVVTGVGGVILYVGDVVVGEVARRDASKQLGNRTAELGMFFALISCLFPLGVDAIPRETLLYILLLAVRETLLVHNCLGSRPNFNNCKVEMGLVTGYSRIAVLSFAYFVFLFFFCGFFFRCFGSF